MLAIRHAIARLPNEDRLLQHVADYFEDITGASNREYPETPVPGEDTE